MYGRIFIKWVPIFGYAVNALRPAGPGLLMYQYMYPRIEVEPVQGQMRVQEVTFVGNLYSVKITTDGGEEFGLKEFDPERLSIPFNPVVDTSAMILKPLLLDVGVNGSFYNFTIEIKGCLSESTYNIY